MELFYLIKSKAMAGLIFSITAIIMLIIAVPKHKEFKEYLNIDRIEETSEQYDQNKVLRWGLSKRGIGKIPQVNPGMDKIIPKYGGIYIGDITKKQIFLTFDEGYEAGHTPKILDVLKQNNVKGTFFITGPYLGKCEDIVSRMVSEGHTVGNHTVNHPSLPKMTDQKITEEVDGLSKKFYEKFGQSMKYLRPPRGEYSFHSLDVTQKMGYVNVFWSFAYLDWDKNKSRGAAYAHDIVTKNLHNGAILLLHAVSKDNADALDSIIKTARKMGYEIGDINTISVGIKEYGNESKKEEIQ